MNADRLGGEMVFGCHFPPKDYKWSHYCLIKNLPVKNGNVAHNDLGQERKRQTSQAEVGGECQHSTLLLLLLHKDLSFHLGSELCDCGRKHPRVLKRRVNFFCVFLSHFMMPKINRNTKLHSKLSEGGFPGRSLINFGRIPFNFSRMSFLCLTCIISKFHTQFCIT